ncbi:hypothetical protein [Pontibacter sp. G13]|uniref:hypothetical protein n=1 Tax=Pontibacter sp. G13 TaxID=3074898 RepID=UPI00288BB435|nr:hypothetical protein [Pontibacter sp. G13]WNJ21459.1 hypothetical protein RJD25_13400 [Pontibacter sp. G13]
MNLLNRIFPRTQLTEQMWNDIEDIIRKLRGDNQLRGPIQILRNRDLIMIPFEPVSGVLSDQAVHLHLKNPLEDSFAHILPGEEVLSMEEGQSMDQFIAKLISISRQRNYLKTHLKSTEYR